MTVWARVTWQVPDPSPFAATLGAALGVGVGAGPNPDTRLLDLGTALLEIRAWVRESSSDEPRPGGRLMLEPVPGGEPTPEESNPDAPRPMLLAGVGWATVELDRAEHELGMWLGDAATPGRPIPPDTLDPLLGARVRVRPAGGLPGESFVLLEPGTEGRVAASLVRDSEGPCALYLRPGDGLRAWAAGARARGVRLSARHAGPLGTEVLVAGGPSAGPHVLVVDAPRSSNRNPPTGTIES